MRRRSRPRWSPACASATRSRSRHTDREAPSRMRLRHWMCRSTTFATSCALRTPTTTSRQFGSCAPSLAGSRPTSCRSTPRRPASWAASPWPVSARAPCSPRTAGRSRAAPAPRALCTPQVSARSRPSATRSCASRTTTSGWPASEASRRAAACTSSTTASTRPQPCHRGARRPAASCSAVPRASRRRRI